MKRMRDAVLLTGASLLTLLPAGGGAPAPAVQANPAPALRATDLAVLRNGVPARPCADARNAVRITVAVDGSVPSRAVPVRLRLVLPGTAREGTVIAEGSVLFAAGARETHFTFLNVEIPARSRGRGARLVASVNADRTVPETHLEDNQVSLALDAATDWRCEGR
jgi:hypothetical protein